MIFLLVIPFSYAQVCEVVKIKDILRKILYLHFIGEIPGSLTPSEVKDLLVFYLSINAQNLTADCSALGANSNRPIFDMMDIGETLQDKIPSCADGTKYGECSKFRPAYCYAGAIYSKCDLCGCPVNSVCGKSGKCETSGQNITCFKDVDCGQNTFAGDYYCMFDYITRNYLNYSCINPGTVTSRCVAINGTIPLTYCNPSLMQTCVNGLSTCKTTINDSAPTVAISVTPTAVAKGQFFNVTVSGADDIGLAAIWWFGVNTTDTELNKAHWYSCNGAKFCSYSWLVSTNATGILTLGANSRDTSYPIAGEPHQASEGAGLAYATVTVTSTTAESSTVTIKGRFVDKFSGSPLPNVMVKLVKSPSETLGTFYANSNGEFAVAMSTTDITQTTSKVLFHTANCYTSDNGIAMSRYPTSGFLTDFPTYTANALYVWTNVFDLSAKGSYFAVSGPEVNVGDVPLWPSADIAVNSDIPVKMDISYPEEGRSAGNVNLLMYHYLSSVVPLVYDTRAKLTDGAGNIYYSPYTNTPLSNGCAAINLNFFNNQLYWNTTQSNITNQTTKPDLIISDMTFIPSNPTTADYVRINITVKNIGTAAAGSSVLRVDGAGTYWRLVVNSLTPFSGYTWQISSSFSAATHTFNATADIDGVVTELNENNNMLTKNLTVAPAIANQTNKTNQTTLEPTGVCIIRSYSSIPSFFDPDLGRGYVKLAKPGVNDVNSLRNACTQTDYKGLLQQYCISDSTPVIQEVVAYSSGGNWISSGCSVIGCSEFYCASLTNTTTPTGVCMVRDLSISIPSFYDRDNGNGYSKLAKPGVNTLNSLKNACSLSDYDALLKLYCYSNSNPIQQEVVNYGPGGGWNSSTCGAYGCLSVNCTSLTSQNISKPDLIVENAYIQPQNVSLGSNFSAWASVKNIGNVISGSNEIKFYYYSYTSSSGFGSLSPTQSTGYLKSGLMTVQALGTNTVRIVVDPSNIVDESNENNNEYFLSFTGASLTNVTCTDSDVNANYPDGKNPSAKGTTTRNDGSIFTDYCVNINQVQEGYCDATSSTGMRTITITCPIGISCSNGACI